MKLINLLPGKQVNVKESIDDTFTYKIIGDIIVYYKTF